MEPRAAIGDFDTIERRLHALHHQPEPARDPPADGRVRAAHPGEQAARRRARRGRRLRLEDLPLRRGSDRHLGRRQGAPAGEVDRRSAARASCRTRMAATTTAPPRWRSTRTATSSALRVSTLANMGALSVHLRAVHPDLSVRDAARRRLQDAGDLLRGEGGVHQHRAGGRLSRRRPAGGDVPAGTAGRCLRARHRHGSRRDPAARISSRPTRSRTRRRSRCNTTAATTRRRWMRA